MTKESKNEVAYLIGQRKKEIDNEIIAIIRNHVPNGGDELNEDLIKKCLRDCAGLQREYQSLQTAYNFFFITPYHGV